MTNLLMFYIINFEAITITIITHSFHYITK